MDTSDFRKPRPDVPILPSRAVFRSTPITPFTRPKGRKGRKPKGRPKTTQAQTRQFLRIKEADEARKGRELAIKKAKDTEARETESLALQRERLRLDREEVRRQARFRADQLRIQDFVSQRDFVRAGLDRQQAERQLFLQAQIAQQQANIQVAGQQQQLQIAQQQQQQQAQIANQRGLQALQDRELREREIGLRQEQLEFQREREEDENIFRASQVARQQQNEQLQQTLEDRRQREARAMYQYFQQSFAESQRRAGENQAQFAQLIADSRNRGVEVSREDFRNLQEQVERLTPKSRPSPAQERKRETTDLRFRGAGGGRSPDQDIEELFDELEARSPESGLEELQRSPPSARTITQKLGQRAEFLKQKLTLSPRDRPTEAEQDPLLRQKLQEQTGVGTFTGTATSPTFEERLRQQAQPPQPELSTPEQREIQQALGKAVGKKRPPPPPKEAQQQQPEITPRTAGRFAVYQKLQPEPEPAVEPEPQPEPTIAEQVGGAVAGVVGTTAGVVSNVGLGVARGIGGAVAESLPTAGQFGEAIGRAGVGGVKAVGGAVAGGIGALLEEPEPAPVKVEKTPYEQLLELRGSEERKFSLSRKPRGAEFGTFERGDTQYVLRGEIKKGLQGDFAIHTIDPKKKSLVYKDLSKPEVGGAEGGFGSTTWSALDKRVGLGSLEVSKRIIGEEEEAQP